ncbi:BTB/POZ domain-containing protein [Aspergillus mulundensis]|uniref:BTB domain-containing protein n=1 Tax=Aspergillus mulundensis TaxID=1810919 RepID=A0A3D8R495_9EURO|nr:Uncharacterized protein DSM5745_08643 [Aspergillus mulundensis]RDW68883.1 Uncharacterized protein DSM5745_08643 [Aspergillus mulundensis]
MSKEHTLPFFSFLDSETVSLKATESGRPFQIHRSLLASKSKTIASAFDRGFEESKKKVYTFQDTSEGTLARFIEWAYTGDYPTILKATHANEPTILKAEPSPNGTKTDGETEKTKSDSPDNLDINLISLSAPETDLTHENHPLLAHIRLYVFCSIYIIPDLRDLAFTRVTTAFKDLNQPTTLDTQLAVIAALRISFHNLLANDRLLDWLAHYAAYCLGQLRVQRDFHDLLQEAPVLGSRMVLSLSAPGTPPWQVAPPKYNFPAYVPDSTYSEEV